MTNSYKIVFKGELLEGFENENVIANLVAISKMDKARAEKLLQVQKPTILKKGLDKAAAEKLAKALTKAGLQVSVVSYDTTAKKNKPASEGVHHPPKVQAAPKEVEKAENPYAAPSADLGVKKEVGGDWLDTPQKVSASKGWKWISSAAKLFFGAPLKWLAMGIIAAVISFPVLLIPVIGSLIYYIPVMIFAGGFMIAAQQQMEGNSLEIKYIFSGFSQNRNQLALVGLLYVIGMFVIGLVSAIMFLVTFGSGFLPLLMGEAPDPEIMAGSLDNMMTFVIIILVATGLTIPMVMALWFSAPLVSLGNRKALQALKQSFQACVKNILPFLVYGLAFLVIGVIFMAAFSALMGIFTYLMADGGSMLLFFLPVVFMMFLGLPLILISGLSVYVGFLDIFSNSTAH
ncbi:MAG: BPSS1780 family membrane protein [Desulfocapsaceae bacterium]|nr:BPSS1780 family membrane protein [Desulfocapsaceae bacterium]